MFCNHCGQQNPDTSRFCNNCGQPLSASAQQSGVPPVAPPSATYLTDPNARNDGKAVASMVLGILSLTLLSILAGIPAVILGHMSRSDIRKSMGKLKGEGLALAGLIMGYISFLAIPFVLIIAAIAIPNLLRARIAANEASSVGSIRTVNIANVTYQETYGQFAPSLAALGCSTGQQPAAEHACLIDSVLATGHKSGYRFDYRAGEPDANGKISSYFFEATPIAAGSSGKSSFCSDESGVIRRESSGTRCTPESDPIR